MLHDHEFIYNNDWEWSGCRDVCATLIEISLWSKHRLSIEVPFTSNHDTTKKFSFPWRTSTSGIHTIILFKVNFDHCIEMKIYSLVLVSVQILACIKSCRKKKSDHRFSDEGGREGEWAEEHRCTLDTERRWKRGSDKGRVVCLWMYPYHWKWVIAQNSNSDNEKRDDEHVSRQRCARTSARVPVSVPSPTEVHIPCGHALLVKSFQNTLL